MRKIVTTAVVVGLSSLLLVGCPSEEGKTAKTGAAKTGEKTGAAAKAEDKYDVSHVKKDQEYVYEMQGGMKMIYKVTKVEADHVLYDTSTVMMIGDKENVTPGQKDTRWPPKAVEGAKTGEAPEGPKPKDLGDKEIKVGDITFKCKGTEVESGGKKIVSWMSKQFPGLILSEMDGKATMELKEVK